MTKPPFVLCYLVIGLLTPWPALAQREGAVLDTPLSTTVVSREDIASLPQGRDLLAILDLHNQVRVEVRSPPLRWNPILARGAQDWAQTVAETGVTQHSSRVGREDVRENVVMGLFSAISPLAMAQTWVNEKSLFRAGVFPDVCTGDWSLCSHYSQMIWSATTDVGCGYASAKYVALVCRYSPKGNIDGELVIELTRD